MSKITETHIKIAAKLYRCRDAAKVLYGDGYIAKVNPYIHYIYACMEKYNLNEMQAATKLGNDISGMDGEGAGLMLIMAALLEILEPSKTTNQ